MKQRIGILLLAVAIALAVLPGYAAAKDASFTLSVANHASMKGNQYVVTVTGVGLDDVYGYEINLKYDETMLVYKKSASLLQGFSVPLPPKDGNLVFAHTKVGKASSLSGKVGLAAITFERIGGEDKRAMVELTRVKLVKSDLTDLVLEPKTKANIFAQAAGVSGPFKDIAGHWAKEAIQSAVESGWVSGYGDGTFRPDATITRAEFVAMIARAFDFAAKGGMTLNFVDTDAIPDWARPYIAEAEQAGMIKGYEDGSFRPDRLISRAEMAVIIMRLHGGKLDQHAKAPFADSDLIRSWSLPSVAAAAELGIIKGKSGNRFAPTDSATRAEATALLLRLIEVQK